MFTYLYTNIILFSIESEGTTVYIGAMDRTFMVSFAPSLWFSKLLAYLSLERLKLVLDIYHALRQWLQRRGNEGMYEILVFETILELKDTEARISKHQQVKFLQENIIAFQDYVWGDGEVFEAYRCTPGIVVDRYQDGDRWNVLISLRETKNAGDITDFRIERTVRNGFTQNKEWFQMEIRHQTRQLKMSIIFPKQRPCKRAVLQERSRHHPTPLGQEHFVTLPDGRQLLTWETEKIQQFEIYTIKWTW